MSRRANVCSPCLEISFHEQLGDGHTIDVSQLMPSGIPPLLLFRLYSTSEMHGNKYGVYEVCVADDA